MIMFRRDEIDVGDDARENYRHKVLSVVYRIMLKYYIDARPLIILADMARRNTSKE